MWRAVLTSYIALAVAAIDCGVLTPCNYPNGTFSECQNPSRRGCCQGIGYWYFTNQDGQTLTQSCCTDAQGNPYIGVLGCSTPTPTTTSVTPTTTTTATPSTTPVCGINQTPCYHPDGSLGECQNPARRGCCKGIGYWYFVTENGMSVSQSCCTDDNGKPYISTLGCTKPPTTCTQVSVVGDATYCIAEAVCSQDGGGCPKVGDIAVADCQVYFDTFVEGKCVSKGDATCQKLSSGGYGCIRSPSAPPTTPVTSIPTTTTSTCGNLATCYFPNGTLSECQNSARRGCCQGLGYWLFLEQNGQSIPQQCCFDKNGDPYISSTGCDSTSPCTQVSVVGDATYCITGPVCSQPGGRCPVKGDVAVADCHSFLGTYNNGMCTAKSDATCQQLPSGTWGCTWSS